MGYINMWWRWSAVCKICTDIRRGCNISEFSFSFSFSYVLVPVGGGGALPAALVKQIDV